MSEEPKSIWKRKWTGRRSLIAWLIFLTCAFFAVGLCALRFGLSWSDLYHPKIVTMSDSPRLKALFISALAIACAVVLLTILARWLFNRRNRRRTLFGIACLITLIALFYAEENWRGHHAWQKYKRELEAKGETVDLAKLAPPPVSDDQNFAMAPVIVESISAQLTNGSARVKNWYGNKITELGHSNLTNHLKMPIELTGRELTFTNGSGDWRQAQKTNLREWREYYRHLATVTNFFPVPENEQTPADDVLFALSKYDSNIEALRVASKRPYSRFPVGYSDENPAGILLPHLSVLKLCQQTLRLRTVAELQSGNSTKALDDVKLMFRLTDSLRTEPILISQLVRIAMIQLTIQPIWEGLAEQRWNNAQLAEIESELSRLDFLADFQFSMRGERGFGVGVIDYSEKHRNWFRDIGNPLDPSETPSEPLELLVHATARAIPSGWFEQNELSLCEMYPEYLFPIVDQEIRIVSRSAQKLASNACNGNATKLTPYNWFTRLLLPALGKISEKSAYAQGATDLARIACALERYRLVHNSFPETLDALAPEFLKTIPHDIIGGQPLKYRRTDDGQFVLYSVGWNETDDGGTVALSKGKTPSVDIRSGDWVWKYPAE
jgi:hypothetical protein